MQLAIGEDLVFHLEGLPSTLMDRVVKRFDYFLNRRVDSTIPPLRISTALPPADSLTPVSSIASIPPLTVRRQGRLLLYEVREVVGWCDLETSRAGIQVGSAEPMALEGFVAMALPSMLFELAVRRGWLGIHAAAVVVAGQGILLPGPSGVGKSTLFENAHQRGFGVLSDDLIWLQERRPSSFRLWAWPAVGAKIQSPPTADGVPLAAIVCPSIAARQEARLEPLPLPRLLEILLPECSFLAADPYTGDRFRRLIRAVGSVPTYRLEAGCDPGRTIGLLRQLFVEDQ